ncbi:MAG TPA: amidase family protein [Solirubrobacterales bacterium]|nr:amidase family protein [Solirubrobacterales bacterium]
MTRTTLRAPFRLRLTFLATLLALAAIAAALLLQGGSPAAAAPTLDLETLTGAEAEAMLEKGEITSVELTKLYLERIDALNKAGPGLNAVTQINKYAIAEAEKVDQERAEGKDLGPAMGLPILLKDIVDAKGMYTSAGDWALRDSFPEKDSGVAKMLRAHGVILLGKLGLSEWANSFGSQPSGFSNLTGQVLNALDAAQGPSGSSSGSGAAAAASLAALTIGTETSGSIISPSTAQGDVGLRPTLGLVPGYGIAPIDASQDTAGPIVRTVEDAAMTLQSIAEVPGTDPEANAEYEGMMGPHFLENEDIQPAPFTELPNYMSALKMSWVDGKRIGYNGTCTGTCTTPTPQQEANERAVEALEEAGAIMVPDEKTTVEAIPSLPNGYEAHATIDEYYKHLGPEAPVKSLAEEVAVDNTNPQEALKDGNSAHANEAKADIAPGGANQKAYEELLPIRKTAFHKAIEEMMNNPSGGGGPVIAVIGSVPSGPQAGDPEIAVPMGYTPTQRRNIAVDVNGGAYDDLDLIGVAYVIEQSTKLRRTPGEIDPSAYRCAHTATPAPFASRDHCNPDYESLMQMLGGTPTVLPFALETTSAVELEEKMEAGTLTAVELVKAELYRAARTNSDGPSVRSIAAIAPDALAAAAAADAERAKLKGEGKPVPALTGIPVLVDDSIDVEGLPTSAGSIALEDNVPDSSAPLVAELEKQGAIILGDTNTTELGGAMEGTNMPRGYSSLGGQVLLPSNTNVQPGGSSGGSTGAVAMGLAPLAVGMESSLEAAQLIAPAGNAGVVGLKPTVGLVSSAGVVPVAKSQDSPGPIAQTVKDVAIALEALTGEGGTGEYTTGLEAGALFNAGLSVIATKQPSSRSAAEQVYVTAENAANSLGANLTRVTPGTGVTAPSVVPFELHRDLDSYLAAAADPGAGSLEEIIEDNEDNPEEALKYGQAGLEAAAAVEVEDPATKAAYEATLAAGKAEGAALLDAALGGRTALMVPASGAETTKLLEAADRAGYPVLSLPAGFGLQNSSTGGDPIGVDLIGAKGSEATLLADAYALEGALKARQLGPEYMRAANPSVSGAPSETNQSMFRCIPGSAFYKPYDCNPGEPGTSSVAIASEGKLETPGGSGGEEAHGGAPGGGPAGGGEGGGGTTPPPASGKPKVRGVTHLVGKGKVLLKVTLPGPGKLTLTGKGVRSQAVKVKKAGTVALMVTAKGARLRTLIAKGHVEVTVKITFLGADGTKTTVTRKVALIEKPKKG